MHLSIRANTGASLFVVEQLCEFLLPACRTPLGRQAGLGDDVREHGVRQGTWPRQPMLSEITSMLIGTTSGPSRCGTVQQPCAFRCTLLHLESPDNYDSKGISVPRDHFGSRKSLVRIQLPRLRISSVPEPTIHERLDPRIGAFLRLSRKLSRNLSRKSIWRRAGGGRRCPAEHGRWLGSATARRIVRARV